MAREANFLWISDIFHNRIRKVYETGNEIKSFYMIDHGIKDLAWDGNLIWAINTAGAIRGYTTGWALSDSITGLLEGGWGLTYGNGYLWASDPNTDRIYQISLDSTPPSSPIDLQAAPAGWSRIDSFSIDWTNPSDASGIGGAYYKLGTRPTSNIDGTYTTTKPFLVSAGTQGGQSLFVWLKDSMDNVDHNNYSVTTLFYDATGPVSGTITINTGDSVTTVQIITLSELSAIDNFSGMGEGSQMKFSNDGSVWSPAEDYDSIRTEWDVADYGGNDNPGLKTVYVKFKDSVGNWSQPFHDDIYYSPPLAIETARLGDGSIGIPYSTRLRASGGHFPYTWSLQSGFLPEGLGLDSDGVISGIPEATGSFVFTVAVIDSFNEIETTDLDITIHETTKADVNGDGQINVLDAALLINNILSVAEFTPAQVWAADVNEDGSVNVLDAAALVNLILTGTPKAVVTPEVMGYLESLRSELSTLDYSRLMEMVKSSGKVVPRSYELTQNCPNPFNTETEIAFGLPDMAVVTLVVYNVLGQVIEVLVDGETMEAGYYVVRWNDGNAASGTYFCRIVANDFTATKRMVLMK